MFDVGKLTDNQLRECVKELERRRIDRVRKAGVEAVNGTNDLSFNTPYGVLGFVRYTDTTTALLDGVDLYDFILDLNHRNEDSGDSFINEDDFIEDVEDVLNLETEIDRVERVLCFVNKWKSMLAMAQIHGVHEA